MVPEKSAFTLLRKMHFQVPLLRHFRFALPFFGDELILFWNVLILGEYLAGFDGFPWKNVYSA